MKPKNLLISTILLIGFILMNSATFAQNHSSKEAIAKHSENRLFKKLQSKTNSSVRFHQPQKNTIISQKTAAINSRLYALSLHENDGVMYIPEDSIRLFWGGANHDPNLTLFLLDLFLYYPNNTPELPEVYEEFNIKVDSAKNYGWDPGPGVFQLYMKTVMSFDDQGNIISETYMDTDDGINWENEGRALYTYDTQGNKTSETYQGWSGTVWENYEKAAYTYDFQNNITEVVGQYWTNATSSWNNSYRNVISYEGSSNISSLIEQNWNNMDNSWENYSRISLLYTANNVIQKLDDYWNGSQWESDEKTEYTYNANNQLTTAQYSYWDDFDQEWYNDYKELYTYDDLGNNTSLIAQSWDFGSWKYEYKEEYTYSSLNITTITAFEWSGIEFTEEARILFTYNDYQQCTEAEIEAWDGNVWAAVLNSTKIKLYYEEFEDGITGIGTIIDRNQFKIYPNPTSDILKVKLTDKDIQQIRIIDITGKTVFESRSGFNASEVNIPVNQLQNGVYILQITSGNQTGAKSFVVRH